MNIRIDLSSQDIDLDELKNALSVVENAKLEKSENSNLTAELMCSIFSAAMNIPMLIVAVLSFREGYLANRRVSIYDEDGKLIKANIRIKDLDKIIIKHEDR